MCVCVCVCEKGGGEWMSKEGGEIGMSNGEGWDDRRRAHMQ